MHKEDTKEGTDGLPVIQAFGTIEHEAFLTRIKCATKEYPWKKFSISGCAN